MINRSLHLVARVAIQLLPPVRAQRVVATLARAFPRIRGEECARALAYELETSGTCLSRAMTIAARVENAQIAIGVTYAPGGRLRAHAWVTLDGFAIRDADPDGEVLAIVSPERGGTIDGRRTDNRSDSARRSSNGAKV